MFVRRVEVSCCCCWQGGVPWRAQVTQLAFDLPAHVKVTGHQADPDAIQQDKGEQRGEVHLCVVSTTASEGGRVCRCMGAARPSKSLLRGCI